MKYVGLDLSTVATGYSVFNNSLLLESGAIAASDSRVNDRMLEIVGRLEKVIRNAQPDKVVIEDVFYGSNYLTTKILNRLAGAVLMMLHTYNPAIVVEFVMPTAARQSLGILPKSKKSHIVAAVNDKFGKSLKLKDNDEADAIVVGYYGFWSDTTPSKKFEKSTNSFYSKGVKTPRIPRKRKNVKK